LRPVGERRFHAGGRHVIVGLPEQLVDLARRRLEPVRRPVTDGTLEPAFPGASLLDPADRGAQILRAPGAPAEVTEPGLSGLGELKAVVVPFAPAAQIHGLSLAGGLLETDHFTVERERLIRLRGQDLDMREMGNKSARQGVFSSGPAGARATALPLKTRLTIEAIVSEVKTKIALGKSEPI